MSRSLAEVSDFDVVSESASGEDAVIATESRPDILLLDVSMPRRRAGCDRRDPVAQPRDKVLMLTNEEVDTLSSALQRGASGYVLKGVGSRALARPSVRRCRARHLAGHVGEAGGGKFAARR